MSATLPAPYLTHPDTALVEGEIELSDDAPAPHESLLAFAQRLLAEVVQDGDYHGPTPEDSSLTVQTVGDISKLRGRIYGQAYAQRQGRTVQFLRVRLYDGQGGVVLTGMATYHTHT
ncbi:MAG: hypothetical protein IIB43_10505 [Candidatus Marinimicrobia bacterium]|nr:hypothetical protein [Candidatus Neomarinimicrobiota bacterium]